MILGFLLLCLTHWTCQVRQHLCSGDTP